MGKWDFLQPCDEEVLNALEAGDVQRAFAALIDGYQAIIVSYCTALMDDAGEGEDVAQEVFVAIAGALHRFESRSTVRHWVFAIARYRCQKHWHKLSRRWRIFRTKRQEIESVVLPEPQATPEDLYHAKLRHAQTTYAIEQVRRGLRRLDPWHRTLIMMYYYEELSFRAIAKQLRVSESTIRRGVHTAEARLRCHFAPGERCT